MNLNDLTPEALTGLVEFISNHPDYRVLTRLKPQSEYFVTTSQSVVRRGIILDTETTGFDRSDKIIELGMILFEYDATTGQVYRVLERFNELEDPGMPISAQATKVNGITDEMVKGKRIDDDEVYRIAMDVDLVIAHNSGFDRPFVEERWPMFKSKPWGCSLKQVAWAEEGFGSAKLDYIAQTQGFFYDAHRAIADCEALLKILQTPLPETGKLGLAYIVDAFQKADVNVAAIGSPFATKDKLSARRVELADGTKRKYIWKGEEGYKYWHIDLPEDLVDAEIAWLQSDIYGSKAFAVSLGKVDAFIRFSHREAQRDRRVFDAVKPQA
jgi:DNA polymerase-3 subunit epsilon